MNMMDWKDEWRLLTTGRSGGPEANESRVAIERNFEIESDSGMGYGRCAHLFL